MKPQLACALSLVALATLTLGACAHREPRSDRSASTPEPATQQEEAVRTPPAASPPRASQETGVPPDADSEQQFTGIEVCDEYLASYKACHSVIGAYSPEDIDGRLAALRVNWLAKARDPAQRPLLEEQCQSLTATMKEALNDRECEQPESDFIEADDDDSDSEG